MTTFAAGARVRITTPIRIDRAGATGQAELLPAGELGTVVRADLFSGRLVQVELDTERATGVRRLFSRTDLEEVLMEIDLPGKHLHDTDSAETGWCSGCERTDLKEPPGWDGAGADVEAQRG